MIKHYCEKCGKEVRKWMVCAIETDTDLDPFVDVPAEEVTKMKSLAHEYEICYDCMAKFFDPKIDIQRSRIDSPGHRVASLLKRRFKYPIAQSRRYSGDDTEEN